MFFAFKNICQWFLNWSSYKGLSLSPTYLEHGPVHSVSVETQVFLKFKVDKIVVPEEQTTANCVKLLDLRRCRNILNSSTFELHFWVLIFSADHLKLLPGECYKLLLMRGQNRFKCHQVISHCLSQCLLGLRLTTSKCFELIQVLNINRWWEVCIQSVCCAINLVTLQA